MRRVVKLFWIDDMESWVSSLVDNLKIIFSLQNIDLVVVYAKNGENIIQQLNIDFDGVIMDYHMEPFYGDHYIKEIRFEEHLEHIPIFFYSQDNSTNISNLVTEIANVSTVYRPNLEQALIERYCH